MAKIPRSVFKGRISTDVPRPAATNVATAGAAFAGFKEVGQGIAQLGQGLGQLQQRREKAASDSYLSTVQAEFDRDNGVSIREDQNFFSGSSFEGYAEARQEFLTGHRDFAIENAPNDLAKERITQYFNRVQGTALFKDTGFEKKAGTNFYLKQDSSNRKLRGETLFEFPSLEGAAQAKAELDTNSANSELYDPAEILDEIIKNKQVIEDNLEGMLRSGGTVLAEGNDFINGRTKFNGMLKELSPQDREKYKKRFEAAAKSEQNKLINNFQLQSGDLIAQVNAMKGTTPTTKAALNSMINIFENLKSIAVDASTEQRINNNLIALKTTKSLAEVGETFKKRSLNDIKDDIVKLDASGSKIKTREAAEVLISTLKYANGYVEAAKEDSAELQLLEDPLLKEGTQELFDAQVARNMPNPRYYKEATDGNIVGTFKTSPDLTKEVRDFLSTGDIKAKKAWLRQKGNIDSFMANISLAADFTDKISQSVFLGAKAKDVNEQFKNHPSSTDTTDSSFTKVLDEDFSIAFSGERQGPFLKAMNEATTKYTKMLMMRGQTLQDAADQAKKDLIDKNYTLLDVPRAGASSGSPQKIPLTGKFRSFENANRIDGFLKAYAPLLDRNARVLLRRDVNQFAETKILIDQIGIKKEPNTFLNSRYKNDEEYVDSILNQEARFELNSKGNAFIITYAHPQEQRKVAVKTFQVNPDGSRSHIDLEIPFEEIISYRNKYAQAVNIELSESNVFAELLGRGTKAVIKEFAEIVDLQVTAIGGLLSETREARLKILEKQRKENEAKARKADAQ